MSDSSAVDQLVVRLLVEALPAAQAIYRYGSAGTVYQREDSDVDLAVLAARKIPLDELQRLSERLAAAMGREVDLLDLRALPVTLRVQIVLEGVRLWASAPARAEAYETLVLSQYVRLNEERREILNDIQQRGQIYGNTGS